MAKTTRLLVADADASVREIIRLSALEEGWHCDETGDGLSALKLAHHSLYQLAVLDVDLPEVDGRILCRHIRRTMRAPVILLGARGAEADRLAAFDAGGNDYLIKPFYPRELIARARSLMLLADRIDPTTAKVACGPIEIDTDAREASVDGRALPLAPKEYDLLLFLCQNPHQAFTRDALLDLVWGPDFYGTDRTVDTHVKSLRGKLRPWDGLIETVWGYGYRLNP